MAESGDMSPADLYEAYASGRIARRAFILRLVGFGMSFSVASAYANSVGRVAFAEGAGGGLGDLYSDLYGNLYGDLYGDLYGNPGGV